MEPKYWLIAVIVLALIEIFTMGLTTIWFVGGALLAFVLSMLGVGSGIQIAVFFLVSIVLLLSTRPLAVKYFNKERHKTNAESLIGEKAVVLEEVDTLRGKGLVEIRGQQWSAKTDAATEVIPQNTVVLVEGIQGVKLIVRKEDM